MHTAGVPTIQNIPLPELPSFVVSSIYMEFGSLGMYLPTEGG